MVKDLQVESRRRADPDVKDVLDLDLWKLRPSQVINWKGAERTSPDTGTENVQHWGQQKESNIKPGRCLQILDNIQMIPSRKEGIIPGQASMVTL